MESLQPCQKILDYGGSELQRQTLYTRFFHIGLVLRLRVSGAPDCLFLRVGSVKGYYRPIDLTRSSWSSLMFVSKWSTFMCLCLRVGSIDSLLRESMKPRPQVITLYHLGSATFSPWGLVCVLMCLPGLNVIKISGNTLQMFVIS